ncbi:hypothetical protein D1816_11265 [Aquimarina sp. AD10]|uniref:hypothetical protein n=2 Tax=Aquimarina sp. AD10 TaxID=1714849 RepID=UPI000E4FF39C|nr:hypothetical protein [Aquimarina sp. AD10]AXT60901.1 hypothetical protein D1816_11265 [Aquimarina sp. AD10]
MSTQDLASPQEVNLRSDEIRKEIKDLFDAKPINDPSYIIYHMIDKHIPNESTKDKILRITQFFNNLYFVESINNTIRDAYLDHNNLRLGFLTNGALFNTKRNKGKVEINEKYNIDELSKLYIENNTKYNDIITAISDQLDSIGDGIGETNISKEKWYFWPGCEMKMPANTTILMDTSVTKSKFVVTKKINESKDDATQIVMEENPYQLEVSLLGDNEFFYKESEDAEERKLKSGFFAINKSEPEFEGSHTGDFSEIDLALKKGEEYDYMLYVPYNSPRLDVLTHMKISNSDETVEEFIATCS